MQATVTNQDRERGQRAKTESIVRLFIEGYSAGRARAALSELQAFGLHSAKPLLELDAEDVDRFAARLAALDSKRLQQSVATARAWVAFAQRWRQ